MAPVLFKNGSFNGTSNEQTKMLRESVRVKRSSQKRKHQNRSSQAYRISQQDRLSPTSIKNKVTPLNDESDARFSLPDKSSRDDFQFGNRIQKNNEDQEKKKLLKYGKFYIKPCCCYVLMGAILGSILLATLVSTLVLIDQHEQRLRQQPQQRLRQQPQQRLRQQPQQRQPQQRQPQQQPPLRPLRQRTYIIIDQNIENKLAMTPPSSICVSTASALLYNNDFIYSPTSQIYAAGMLNNQFGIYIAYGYGGVTSTAIWKASQTSTSGTCYLALQTDRNLVVYTLPSGYVWTPFTNNGGIGLPFCLSILDSGNLIWTNSAGIIIWQSNSAQSG
ncbi:unnamed protein product [Rotaria magnacalcarata]|nr:unnamed protein product [Rotaria magnacalcarata]